MNGPSEEQPTSEVNEEQQALATFHHAAEELRFFKGQQWHVTNYALIAYAALVAAARLVENCRCDLYRRAACGRRRVGGAGAVVGLGRGTCERGRLFTAREGHLPLIKRIHDGTRREYRSEFSRRLASFRHPSVTLEATRDSIADDAFVWLSAAVVLGAILALVVIIAGPPPHVGG